MIDIAGGSNDVYSVKRLKQKLQDKYKDFIFFAEVQGRKNVVCLRNMADCIINDKWYEAKKQNIQDESERIVACAAKIINAEIREMTFKTDTYPSNHVIRDTDAGLEWLPPLLKNFMNKITKSEIQQASIGLHRALCTTTFGDSFINFWNWCNIGPHFRIGMVN